MRCAHSHSLVPDIERPSRRGREGVRGKRVIQKVECVDQTSEEGGIALEQYGAVVHLGKENAAHEQQRAAKEEEADRASRDLMARACRGIGEGGISNAGDGAVVRPFWLF